MVDTRRIVRVSRASMDSTRSKDVISDELWVDPRVRNAFFLSDRLAQALKAAKLARSFGPFRCRVVETA